jgi:DNA-binding XRE family transcriptional regulator
MDQWEFKKWRKKLGINQIEAGDMLGLSRAAVQCWESEIRPVPRAVELACKELLRRWWKQGPQFGPVILFYVDAPISQMDSRADGDLVLRCELYPNNESALARVLRLRETANLFMPLIVENDGTVIWSGPELLRECEARKGARHPK